MSTITRSRACGDKRKLSRAGAEALLARLVEAGSAEGSMNAYQCPFDRSHWHVGHTPGRAKRGGRS